MPLPSRRAFRTILAGLGVEQPGLSFEDLARLHMSIGRLDHLVAPVLATEYITTATTLGVAAEIPSFVIDAQALNVGVYVRAVACSFGTGFLTVNSFTADPTVTAQGGFSSFNALRRDAPNGGASRAGFIRGTINQFQAGLQLSGPTTDVVKFHDFGYPGLYVEPGSFFAAFSGAANESVIFAFWCTEVPVGGTGA